MPCTPIPCKGLMIDGGTTDRTASLDLAAEVQDKVALISKLEDQLKKQGAEIIYQEVVKEVEVPVVKEVEVEVIKEVEVEKIVTQIEYREVEVIKEVEVEVEKIVPQIEYREVEVIKEVEVEVEKIVTQIEYRDVIKEVEVEVTQIEYRDVIKEVEVEKIVTQIEYREVEVIKEVEVEVMREVFKSPIKAAERVSANDKKPKKAALHSAAPLPATSPTAPATSGGSIRTVGKGIYSTLI